MFKQIIQYSFSDITIRHSYVFFSNHVILEDFVRLRRGCTVCDWTVQLLFKVTHCFLDLTMTKTSLNQKRKTLAL